MLIRQAIRVIVTPLVAFVSSLARIWFHGVVANKLLKLDQVLKRSTRLLPTLLQNSSGFNLFSMNSAWSCPLHSYCGVTTLVPPTYLPTQFFMLGLSILKLISTLFVIWLPVNASMFALSLALIDLLIYWPSQFHPLGLLCFGPSSTSCSFRWAWGSVLRINLNHHKMIIIKHQTDEKLISYNLRRQQGF